MEVSSLRNKKITVLAECAIMVALAFVLSCARLGKMPLGGSVTVASMLPIMLISIKYGNAIGLGTAFVYSATQLLQAVIESDVFPYCETPTTLVICVLFDYLFPFTVLGLSGAFMKVTKIRHAEIRAYIGSVTVVVARFLSHFITGVAIWGQWAPDGMGKYLYSFLYNGSFLSADFLICIICAVLMFRKAEIRKLVELDRYK